MGIENVCRLCLTTDDLVWVFDKRFDNSDNMKDIIYVTTGVEITDKDIISQKVCRKCCQVTIKMLEFRRTSLKNDQHLKDQCKAYLKEKEIKIPNTQVTIRSEPKKTPHISVNSETKTVEVKQDTKSAYKIHPSVRELFREYPKIKLPTVCLKYDITPTVSMKMDQVEEYFKSRHLDIQKYTKLALKAGRIATKKTTPIVKAKNLIPPSVPKVIKTERKDKTAKSETNAMKTKVADYKVNGDVTSKEKIKSHFKDSSKTVAKSQATTPDTKRAEEEPSSIKRKLPKDEKTGKESKKSNFVESLGLTPKADPPTAPSGMLSYVANKSQPLHICEICNSVQYTAKDLRKHQNRHLKCQFCKIKLRSLDMKKEHLDGMCKIKNMMRNMPQIVFEKIEFVESVRLKYPEAFESFPPIQNKSKNQVNENTALTMESGENSNDNLVEFKGFDNTNEVKPEPPPTLRSSTSAPCEIIEILSDDDEPSASTLVTQTTQSSTPTSNVFKEGTSSLFQTPQSSVPPTVLKEGSSSSSVVPNTALPQQDNIVYNTVSIVKPDIKIKGNCALDTVDARLTDIKVLKELLTNYRPVQVFMEKNIQTYPPNNEFISVNCSDRSAELKQLKPHLYVYKIPVVMKNGSFNACYNFNHEPNQPKKLCLWNDLTPVDLKPLKVLPHQIVATDAVNRTILPSTATYNSSGVISWPVQPTTSKFIRVNASSLSPMINNFLQNSPGTETTTLATNTETPAFNAVERLDTVLTSSAVQHIDMTLDSTAAQQLDTTSTQHLPPKQTPSPVQQFGTIRVKNVWELT